MKFAQNVVAVFIALLFVSFVVWDMHDLDYQINHQQEDAFYRRLE